MDKDKEILILKGKEATRDHIEKVRECLNIVCIELRERAVNHDKSKLGKTESELFGIMTPRLKEVKYPSEEYDEALKELKPALDHHYAKNSHHPEHYPGGIDDMNLLDIIEMYADWKSATLRIPDGNIKKSIEYNKKRFNISDQLTKIFENTSGLFDKVTEN